MKVKSTAIEQDAETEIHKLYQFLLVFIQVHLLNIVGKTFRTPYSHFGTKSEGQKTQNAQHWCLLENAKV